ncbi:MAG: hypothetical protein V4577_22360 [Bacteroidota bacterium]
MINPCMYKWIIALLFLSSCRQVVIPSHQIMVDSLTKVNDTDIITSDTAKGEHYFVYIQHNHQSPEHNGLLEFKPDSIESAEYREAYKILKDSLHTKFKTFGLKGLPTQWVELNLYKGKYYLYFPSDFGNAIRKMVTDSTIVDWGMEGPIPSAISTVVSPGINNWTIGSRAYYNKSVVYTTIDIIDPKNKTAVWTQTGYDGKKYYQLFVPKENARNFDMIVSYCRDHKTGEFNFDKIDYPALLKQK